MYKLLFLLGLLCPVKCEEVKAYKYVDPFAALDRQISHTLAYHYLWPWSKLMTAVAALDAQDSLQEPQIIQDSDRFEVNLNVKRFKPDELKIIVKNKYITVEGKHKEKSDDKRFVANHFVQQFVLPTGSKPEEVKAVLKRNGVLAISAPRHALPPPIEREVPIVVELVDKEGTENKEHPQKKEQPGKKEHPEKKKENRVEKESSIIPSSASPKEASIMPSSASPKEASIMTSSASPIEQLELLEPTTTHGKIRKKELKTTTKTSKDNEVAKGGDGNGLDYALIEAEE